MKMKKYLQKSMFNKLCQILKIEDEFLNLIYYEQTIRF